MPGHTSVFIIQDSTGNFNRNLLHSKKDFSRFMQTVPFGDKRFLSQISAALSVFLAFPAVLCYDKEKHTPF